MQRAIAVPCHAMPKHETHAPMLFIFSNSFPSLNRYARCSRAQWKYHKNICSTWEEKHLNPSWSFENELGRKIRALFEIMYHPINMDHLARLFTSQLIQSCNYNVSIMCLL